MVYFLNMMGLCIHFNKLIKEVTERARANEHILALCTHGYILVPGAKSTKIHKQPAVKLLFAARQQHLEMEEQLVHDAMAAWDWG